MKPTNTMTDQSSFDREIDHVFKEFQTDINAAIDLYQRKVHSTLRQLERTWTPGQHSLPRCGH